MIMEMLQKKGEHYYDCTTDNMSFMNVAEQLRKLGIKNYRLPLTIKNPDLIGINPYANDLTPEQEILIYKEARDNIWYFLREIANVPDSTGNMIPVSLTVQHVAQIFLYEKGISSYSVTPRMTGKDAITRLLLAHHFIFHRRSRASITATSIGNSRMYLSFIKETVKDLPTYIRPDMPVIQMEKAKNKDGEGEIIAKPCSTALIRACNMARGMTEDLIYMVDFEYIKFNKELLDKILESRMYGLSSKSYDTIFLITSSAAKYSLESSLKAKKIRENSPVWNDEMLDMTEYELRMILRDYKYPIVYIEKSKDDLNIDPVECDKQRRILGEDHYRNEILLDREV